MRRLFGPRAVREPDAAREPRLPRAPRIISDVFVSTPAGRRKAFPVSDLQSQINQRIQSFVEEIAELARRQALESMSRALGAAMPAPRGRKAVAAPSPSAGRGRSRGKGEKRPASEIAAIVERLGQAVKTEPGLRIEQLAGVLSWPTKEMTLPMRKLIATGAVRTEGQRRATKYFPGDGAAAPRKRRGKRA